MRFRVLALLALLATPASAQYVPAIPQILPAGTIIGNINPTAGPAQAIPKALWLSYVTSGVFTQGSVFFGGGGGVLAQDNANFFWDDTNNRLGLGTASPSTTFHVVGNETVVGNLSQTGNITLTGNLTQTGTLALTGGMTATGTVVAAGTTTNDSASAGNVGEVISSSVVVGSAVALTTTVANNVTSISLTAGDWTVCGNVLYSMGGTTTTTVGQAAVSSTSATLPTAPAGGWSEFAGATFTGFAPSRDITCHRQSLASTTTLYLVAKSTFATSTLAVYGSLYARRVR